MKLAIIPARGGSKRIPRKNIKPFAGRPMISWAIEAARSSGLFDYVMCSTDDPEIAAIAQEWGANVPELRPDHLADDLTSTRHVFRHAIEVAEGATDETASEICCIYATAAFVEPQDIVDGLQLLRAGDPYFAFAATPYRHPIERAFTISDRGGVRMAMPEAASTRSQDLATHYHDVGMFYWGTREGFFSDEPMFGHRSRIVTIPPERAHDIDEPADWQFAEIVFQAIRGDKR